MHNTPSILTALGIVIDEKNYTKDFLESTVKTADKEKLYELNILPITASMLVDEKNMHPFGMLSGGASLALAECLAGYASLVFCNENEFPSGIQVSANHTLGAKKGVQLFARADIVHKGKKTHVWNVDITNEDGDLISSARVTNLITTKSQNKLSI